MSHNILVITDDFVEPPSEVLPFRTITLLAHYNLEMDVLLHTTQEMKDMYYKFMKRLGMYDYVSYILNELEFEDGIRLDTVGIYPHVIVAKYIRIENQIHLLGKIKSLSGK